MYHVPDSDRLVVRARTIESARGRSGATWDVAASTLCPFLSRALRDTVAAMSVAGLEGLPAAVLRVRDSPVLAPGAPCCARRRRRADAFAPQELPAEPADVLAVAQQIAAYAFAAKARAPALAFPPAGRACLGRAPLSAVL